MIWTAAPSHLAFPSSRWDLPSPTTHPCSLPLTHLLPSLLFPHAFPSSYLIGRSQTVAVFTLLLFPFFFPFLSFFPVLSLFSLLSSTSSSPSLSLSFPFCLVYPVEPPQFPSHTPGSFLIPARKRQKRKDRERATHEQSTLRERTTGRTSEERKKERPKKPTRERPDGVRTATKESG